MSIFRSRKTERAKFDRKILRRNNISLLILDERWTKLFVAFEKTLQITISEEKLKELLKDHSRLLSESKEIAAAKKQCMDKIIKLTTAVFEQEDNEAKKEMQQCEKEIKRVNERFQKIEEEIDAIPDKIGDANLELLENIVNVVYFKIRSDQKRVDELAILIEETKEKLKAYIDEKETLSQDHTDIYSYFHDLLGAEELERLDAEFFGKK